MNYFLISFLLGIFLADFLNYNPTISKILISAAALLFTVAIFWRKDKVVKNLGLCGLALCLALFYFQFFLQKPDPQYVSYYNGQTLTLQGTVDAEPQKSEKSNKLIIKINNIKGKVLVNTPLYPEYQFGDQLKIKGKLEEPPVFDEFNYRNYLKPQGIYSTMRNAEISKIGEASGFSLKKSLIAIKNRFSETINKTLPEPEAALASGLLLGEKRGLPDWLTQAFIAVGIIHIIALSGYNVTIISKNLSVFFGWFAPQLAFWFSVFAIWIFVVMVGAGATIIRAALMGSMYLVGQRFGRRRDMTRILLLTAFFMVLINPFVLKYDTGFQLSFMATASLMYLAPILEKWILKWKLPSVAKEAGVATVSAQLFVLPLLLFSFKKISLVAPLVNIIVLPIIPLTMFFIFVAGVFGMFVVQAGQVLGWVAFLFLKYIILVANYCSKIPFASMDVKTKSFLWAILYWAILFFVIRLIKKRQKA